MTRTFSFALVTPDYFELLTESVEWKTGGAMKNIVSAGIVEKDLKGAVTGPSSTTS